MSTIKARATLRRDDCAVKALISHPMETGLRKDKKTGKNVPAHYITELNVTHNGKNVLNALWGPAVSKNPYLYFKFGGAKKGESVTISWTDNQGKSDKKTLKIR